jgi:hypothetical protein
MSKKYKGKLCVYCATRESTCPDHVIAREFFPANQRANIPKVPSCDECNNTKSKLEHYATTVLLFGSRHVEAIDMLKKTAPKRLDKNLKLKRELQNKMERIWIKSTSDLILPTMIVPIKRNELIQLFSMIVRGLYWHNWKMVFPADYIVEILTINLQGLIEFRNNLPLKDSLNFVQDNFGNGVFHYCCIRADDDPGISAWEMFFYNGIMIAGQKNQLIFFCSLTGPKEIWNGSVSEKH